ncbi:MAG: flavodoxin domain-containing protein [Candidatus Latescibacterota bacterium]
MPFKSPRRRKFLKVAGISLGASALLCSGLSYRASWSPERETSIIETPEFTFGKRDAMSKRVLVVYATRLGSTVGVAAAIGETLGARGLTVDVKPVRENPPLDSYSAVIIGSAVNGGQWLAEAVEYVRKNRQTLTLIPVALFCVHIMNLGDDEKSTTKRLAYLDAVRSLLQPVDEAFFAGASPVMKQNFLAKWVYRTFKVGPEGDCRDWEKIRGWGEKVLG